MVPNRRVAVIGCRHLLDIGFDDRAVRSQVREELPLALNNPVEHIVVVRLDKESFGRLGGSRRPRRDSRLSTSGE